MDRETNPLIESRYTMTIKDLKIGSSGIIQSVGGEGALRQHFLDMGMIPGAKVTVVKYAPMGDPVELQVHGYQLTLRLDDADRITVEPVPGEAEGFWQEREYVARVLEGPGADGRARLLLKNRFRAGIRWS